MISLERKTEPYELTLPYGVTVTVTPLTTATMAAAQAEARKRLARFIHAGSDVVMADMA